MRPLAYLQFRLFVNGIKHIGRSPKRLIPAILIVLFIVPSLLMNLAAALIEGPRYSGPDYLRGLPAEAVWSAIFTVLALVVLYTLYNALSEGLLIFSPSHIDFVFPSPINSRIILAFKLLGDYSKYALFSAFIFLVALMPFYNMTGGSSFARAISAWIGTVFLLIVATNLSHTVNIATTYASNRLLFAGRMVRFGALILLASVVLAAAYRYMNSRDALASLVGGVHSGAARIILAPVAWCVNLIVGPLTGETAGAGMYLGLLALCALASLLLLLARPENFYEPSLGISGRMARLRAAGGNLAAVRTEAMRRRRNRSYSTSFIPPFGVGASALIWKNLVMRNRASRSTLTVLLLLPPLLAALVGNFARDPDLLRFSPFAMVYVIWIVSSAAQQELRSEFRQVDIIKAMPASGFSVVAAQVFSQWIIIAVLTLVGATSILIFIREADPYFLVLATAGSLTLGFTCTAASSIPVLLYPDASDKWQMLIPAWLTMFIVGIVMLPSVIAGVILAIFHVHIAIVVFALVAINAPISWGVLALAGKLFERFDPTAD